MAGKRMFSMKICDSDAFLDMPMSTQCLYFHLNMRADDDGFIGNPRKIMKFIGASEDDLKLLIAKRFVLVFEDSGVIVIKHWRMHNTISKNRYHETQYVDEKSMLRLKENNAYTFDEGEEINDVRCIEQSTRQSKTQQRRNIDEQKTDSGLGLGLGLDLDLETPLDSLRSSKEFSSEQDSDPCEKEQIGKNDVPEETIEVEEEQTVDASELAQELKEHSLDISVEEIVNEYNRVCTDLPTVQKISKKRRDKVKARLKAYSVAEIYKAFDKASSSSFLCGKTSDWKANFDWFFENDNNLLKVLEGNYDNRVPKPKNSFNSFDQRSYDMKELESKLINNSG